MRKIFTLIFFLLTLLHLEAAHTFTVVVDAGHGGNDCGAKGLISYEKNLTLRYALALGAAIEQSCPDVRVIYTRRTDLFIPLHERADIANRNKANLFMSVHINALAGGRISHGFQSYTLGSGDRTGSRGIQENMEVAKRENSVIFMEKDYKTRYKGLENSAEGDIMFELIADKNRERSVEFSRILQREVCRATGRENGGAHQNNLAVLRLTSMPAVLLELGFITTPDEENYLNTDSALNAYTKGIVSAFKIYKQRFGGTDINIPYKDTDNDSSRPQVPEVNDADKPAPIKTNATPQRRSLTANEIKPRKDREIKPKKETKTQIDRNEPVFKIQIFAGRQKLKENSPLFKGLDNYDNFIDGGIVRYTYGASNNYNEIKRLRTTILDKFPDCFIIAMKGGKIMDVNEAIREYLNNKKK